jgi:hypothetical protein
MQRDLSMSQYSIAKDNNSNSKQDLNTVCEPVKDGKAPELTHLIQIDELQED